MNNKRLISAFEKKKIIIKFPRAARFIFASFLRNYDVNTRGGFYITTLCESREKCF